MSNTVDKSEQHASPETDVKREVASSPETKPPSTSTPRKRKAATSASSSSSKSPKTQRKSGVTSEAGEWTPEKRAKFFDHIIAAGARNTDLDALAAEVSPSPSPTRESYRPPQLGLNTLQLKNQVQAGRKSNFRYRAVRYISGEDEGK